MLLNQFHYLQTEEGSRLLHLLREFDPDAQGGLGVINRARKRFPPEMVSAGMTLHLLRKRARSRFQHADAMWFTRPGYEQASSDRVATHRASRFAGLGKVADFCCGIGGDAMQLGTRVERLHLVDSDPVHLEMAVANVALNQGSASVTTELGDVRKVQLDGFDAVFVDPARRDEVGRHATGITDPPLDWCIELGSRIPRVAIKLAPGLPHHLIPDGWSFETIATDFDLKESVLWSPTWSLPSKLATVIDGDSAATFTEVAGGQVELTEPRSGQWLMDPNPAITRAGLVEDLARKHDLRMIDSNIAFLIGDAQLTTPFARAHRIVQSIPWHERNVQQAVRDLDGGEVVIRRRGLPGNVDDITRRLRGDGNRRLLIAMTRLQDRPWAIICEM